MNNTADGYIIYFQRIKMKNTWLKIEYWEFPQKILPHIHYIFMISENLVVINFYRIDLFTCFLRIFFFFMDMKNFQNIRTYK